jgi:hypothetical protein
MGLDVARAYSVLVKLHAVTYGAKNGRPRRPCSSRRDTPDWCKHVTYLQKWPSSFVEWGLFVQTSPHTAHRKINLVVLNLWRCMDAGDNLFHHHMWLDAVSQTMRDAPTGCDQNRCANDGFIAESLGAIARGSLCICVLFETWSQKLFNFLLIANWLFLNNVVSSTEIT